MLIPPKRRIEGFRGFIPGSRFGRLYSCPYDVAVSYARRQWYLAARVIRPLLASETMRVALMPEPAVLLDLEWREQRAMRLWLQSAGHSRGNAAWQYARPSRRALVGAPPSANALSDPKTEICRRERSRRMSRGRSPPYILFSSLRSFDPQDFLFAATRRRQKRGRGTPSTVSTSTRFDKYLSWPVGAGGTYATTRRFGPWRKRTRESDPAG